MRSTAAQLELLLDQDQVMIDFEIAAKKAFEKIFHRCKVIDCLFHFSQSLFKMFCKIGLKQLYLENEDVQVWFKSVFCLELNPKTLHISMIYLLKYFLNYIVLVLLLKK